jgi:predicted PurR-regulated permease PerM
METNVPKPATRWISRSYVFAYFFFAVFLFLLYQVMRVTAPFLNTILVAIVVALVFFPFNLRIRRKMPGHQNLAAGITLALVIIMLIAPLVLTGWMLTKESKILFAQGQQLLGSLPKPGADYQPAQGSLMNWLISTGNKFNIDVQEMIFGNIQSMGEIISVSGAKLLRNMVDLLMDFTVLILLLFLFFRDGERLAAKIIELAPMDIRHKKLIADRLYVTIGAVVRGVLLTAAIQGSTASIGYAIAGIHTPITLGILTAAATLLPIGGSAIIWLPAGLYTTFYISKEMGVFLLLWGVIIIAWMDNIFRPLLIGRETNLPVVILFLALIGGLRTYGPAGLLLGPMLVACTFVFIKIYQEELGATAPTIPENRDAAGK